MVFLLATGIFILDRVTKLVALHYLEPLMVPAPTFGLGLFLNPTFAFGIPGGNTLAIMLSTLVVLALVWVVMIDYRKRKTFSLGAGLIIAGAFGNLADRLTRDAAVDWIVAGPWTVNVADVAILLGVLMLIKKSKS